jgi:hypothetical protein
MTLEELGERLADLEEARKSTQEDLEETRDRYERLEALEWERRYILGFCAGVAHFNVNGFPPQERRRLYEALGLKVVVNADGEIDVRGDLGPTAIPAQEKAYELVASMVSLPEQNPQDESLRAMIARILQDRPRGDVMPGKTIPS